jgi:hypothetical protein
MTDERYGGAAVGTELGRGSLAAMATIASGAKGQSITPASELDRLVACFKSCNGNLEHSISRLGDLNGRLGLPHIPQQPSDGQTTGEAQDDSGTLGQLQREYLIMRNALDALSYHRSRLEKL